MDIIERIIALEQRIDELEARSKKKAKSDINNQLKFQEYKETFLSSNPEERTDDFSDGELVLWFSYVLWKNKLSTDRVIDFPELYKRVKKLKIVLSHYSDMYYNKFNVHDDDNKEKWIRNSAKLFLEYMATVVKIPENKQYNFYYVCDQWALNQYAESALHKDWRYIKNMEDKPAE